jgi:Putative amidoligase enzyme
MMKTIAELLGKPSKAGDVGIEIECEGDNLLRAIPGDYWKAEADGSLRGHFPDGACEYVLDKPIGIKEVQPALQTLIKALEDNKAKLNFSFRTSVHVHINVLGLTEQQLDNLILTYLLLEEPLMNYCGKERKCNRFCLRVQDSEGVVEILSSLCKEGVQRYCALLREDNVRYSAFNIAALKKYGSVEFRGMRGTLDQGVLLNWVNALYAMREFAKKMPSAVDIGHLYEKSSYEEFLKEVLGEFLYKNFIYKNMKQDMDRSFSLCWDVQYALANKEYKEQEEKPKKPPLGKPPVKIEWNNPGGDFANMVFADIPPEIVPAPRFHPVRMRMP